MADSGIPIQQPSLRLQYFNIAGRAEKVRLALAVGGIPFDDDRVVYADWPEVGSQVADLVR